MPVWTDAQKSAIDAPVSSGAILVSAAAGSGKTAVLVERVITKLLEGKIDIDRLLIVTFTDAAAAEMKEKIIIRLQEALAEADNEETEERLKMQLRLAGDADIMTIDAFCLRVMRNNFHAAGVDPNFFIADPAEAEMMKDSVLDALFDRMYVEDNQRFIHLTQVYSSNRNDSGLKRIILTIYGFIQSFAEPILWLDEKADMYTDDMAHSEWASEYVIKRRLNVQGENYYNRFCSLASEMAEIAGLSGIPEADNDDMKTYWGTLWRGMWVCINAARKMKEIKDWDEAYDFYLEYIKPSDGMDSLIPSRMPKRKQSSDEDWKSFCEQRNEVKKEMRSYYKKLVNVSAEEFNEMSHCHEVSNTVHDVVWLVKEFDSTYVAAKESRGIKEFHDIEHMAYNLFCENENIRNEYRDKYDEILIDEYQDTNGLQDAIFEKISNDGKNIFTVGDLKQSIYRFRGGDPDIFKNKSRRFLKDDNDGTLIMLSQNFRSRMEVLNSVNDIFYSVMSDEIGDVVYEGGELVTRDEERECYPKAVSDNISELHRISVFAGEELGESVASEAGGTVAERVEASYIADRIYELLNSKYQVYDKGLQRYRDIRCKDITILAKSVRYTNSVYINALSKRGIPAFAETEDYFDRREIGLIITLISLINNHLQDIPLISVMRSPIGGFSDNELAMIRLRAPKTEYFYEAVEACADSDSYPNLKCRGFIAMLERWRGYAKQKSVAGLIWTIYSETGFYDFMGALEGGEEAQANLKLLYERAKQYEKSGFKGLFNFLRYIDKLRNRREDLSGAKLIGENHDVVRIMTIHKSKGLEFPVVFLAGMGKRLKGNSSDEGRILLHKDMGFGMKYANAEESYYKDTMMKNFVAEENNRELLSEVMRLLYVAATRPKEKLIVTAVRNYASAEKCTAELEKWESLIGEDKKAKASDVASLSHYIDWLCPAALKSENWKFIDADLSALSEYDDDAEQSETVECEASAELTEAVGKILGFEYKYPKSGFIPSKTSVSALKQMNGADTDVNIESKPSEYDFSALLRTPAFMRETVPAAEIGTAHHQLMAFIDFEGVKNAEDKLGFIKSEIERIVSDGQIDSAAVTEDMAEHCLGFFKSELAKRLFLAKKIYREQTFQIEVPASLYDSTLGAEYNDETVILQGVIDCYFEEEDGGVVLLDYKTDKVSDIDEIAEKYRLQLDLYAEAIERITKKSVKDKYLYLFSVKSVVKL